MAGIPHRDARAFRLDTRGADMQFAVAVLNAAHRLDGIDDQVKHHLLQLHPHRMVGESFASCVPSVTPLLTASLWVRAVTSRIVALRSTTSFLGGVFLMRDPIRSTT